MSVFLLLFLTKDTLLYLSPEFAIKPDEPKFILQFSYLLCKLLSLEHTTLSSSNEANTYGREMSVDKSVPFCTKSIPLIIQQIQTNENRMECPSSERCLLKNMILNCELCESPPTRTPVATTEPQLRLESMECTIFIIMTKLCGPHFFTSLFITDRTANII